MSRTPAAHFTQPPPAGVECDCEVGCACADPSRCEHERSHWHTRFMGAVCDTCHLSSVQADVHTYTREGAFEAIARYAKGQGWVVTDGRYTCPTCRQGQR